MLVGEERVVFEVHLGILCEASSYFTAAFSKGRFAESYSRELMINEDPYTVDLFIRWAYGSGWGEDSEEADGMDAWTMQLVKLYIFANKYLISGLERHVVCYLHIQLEKSSHAPPFAAVGYVYQNTLPKMAEIREIFITWLIAKSDPVKLKERIQGELLALPECLADLAVVFQPRFLDHCHHCQKDFGGALHVEGWH